MYVEVGMLEKQPSGIEEELKRWQAERARNSEEGLSTASVSRDRRTVRINGREVEIVKKRRRAAE